MLLFHICYTNGNFYLWSEHSFRSEQLVLDGRTHPYCSSKQELKFVFERLGLEAEDSLPRFVTATVEIPASKGVPLPASHIIGDCDTDTVSLQQFEVPVIALSPANMAQLKDLLDKRSTRLTVSGIMPGNDATYFIEAFKYASLLALRGCFIPYMKKTEQGCISCWEPIYLPKYHSEYVSFLRDMPPVLRHFSVNGSAAKNTEQIGREILAYFMDGIVRTAQKDAKGKIVQIDNTHEMWLRSLTWPHSSLSNWTKELRSVYPQIAAWAEEAKTGSGEPWRLVLRIEEPDRIDDDTRWLMTWSLQALRDEAIVIPAERVWSPTETERKCFDFVGENPRKYLLQTLGVISSYIPPIEDSLYKPTPVSCEFTAQQLYDFMTEALPRLFVDGVRVQYPAAWGRPEDRARFAVSGSLSDDTGSFSSSPTGLSLSELLDVNWSITLGNEILTPEELEMLTKVKSPFVELHGKTVFVNKDELAEIVQKLEEMPKKIDRRSALLSTLTGNFDGQRLASMRDSSWLDDAVAVLTGKQKLPELGNPENFRGTLRPYQLRGLSWLDWLTKLGLGGCLADDMGLGKTIETLALIQQQRNEGKRGPVLLICPTSVVENWRLETERFTPNLKTYIHYGIDRKHGERFVSACAKADIVITSYSLLSRDYAALTKIPWRGAILDEAQNIKNPVTRQSRTAHSIDADWHLALTGTPVENHVGDLWSILEFCVPGLLPNKTRFAREFLRPIQAGNTAQLEKLTLMSGPFILRRVKTDKEIIADLPEKIETREFCPLGREQASLYAAVVGRLDKNIAGSRGIQRKGLVLSTITNLKEICDHPALFLKDNSLIADRSGKLARLSELVEDMLASGDRALIFTQYASMGAILKNYLQETFGTEVLFLHGGLSKERRDELIKSFERPDGPQLFVLSLKAGGTGLNLTGANHVILFDRWWNPAVEQQAVDRAYRIGQNRNVMVHYFCCKGTLEEKIEKFIHSKQKVANAVVREGENWLTELSDAELHDLFALNITEEEND